jgi:hypothetical protein
MENEFENAETQQEAAPPEPAEGHGLRLPFTLALVALLVWFGFQAVELVFERNQLVTFKSRLDPAMQEAEKMQAHLKALITQTAELANKGNANAKAAVEELQKRGIPVQSIALPAK